MYCSHFGLHRLPFNNTPDPTFYFSTPEHEEALATLQYATQERKGFVLVTGEVGAGKTLIARMFLRLIQNHAQTAVITNTNLDGDQLFAAVGLDDLLGALEAFGGKAQGLAAADRRAGHDTGATCPGGEYGTAKLIAQGVDSLTGYAAGAKWIRGRMGQLADVDLGQHHDTLVAGRVCELLPFPVVQRSR